MSKKVNDYGFCGNCIGGGLAALGKCGLCPGRTPYCNYKLCEECSLKNNLCQACGLSPEESDRRRAERKASLKEIPYMYTSKQEDRRAKDDVTEAQDNFKKLIVEKFPEITISHSYSLVFGGVITIPTDKEIDYKKVLEDFGYTLSIMV